MTALLTEVQTAEKMVKIAREQVDAFNTATGSACEQRSPPTPA